MCRTHPRSLIRTDPMRCLATTPLGRLIRPHRGLSNTYRWRSVTAAIRPLPTPIRNASSLDGPQAAARIVSPDSRNKLADSVIFCSCLSSLIVSSLRYRVTAPSFGEPRPAPVDAFARLHLVLAAPRGTLDQADHLA